MSDSESDAVAFFLAQGMTPKEIEMYQEIWKTYAQNDEEAEDAIQRIIISAAERAKVLFDVFGFQWITEESRDKTVGEHKYEVPSLERIIKNLEENVRIAREHNFFGGSGRLHVFGEHELDDLICIRLFFELGEIPIQYLWENGPNTAKRMEYENRCLTSKVKTDE